MKLNNKANDNSELENTKMNQNKEFKFFSKFPIQIRVIIILLILAIIAVICFSVRSYAFLKNEIANTIGNSNFDIKGCVNIKYENYNKLLLIYKDIVINQDNVQGNTKGSYLYLWSSKNKVINPVPSTVEFTYLISGLADKNYINKPLKEVRDLIETKKDYSFLTKQDDSDYNALFDNIVSHIGLKEARKAIYDFDNKVSNDTNTYSENVDLLFKKGTAKIKYFGEKSNEYRFTSGYPIDEYTYNLYKAVNPSFLTTLQALYGSPYVLVDNYVVINIQDQTKKEFDSKEDAKRILGLEEWNEFSNEPATSEDIKEENNNDISNTDKDKNATDSSENESNTEQNSDSDNNTTIESFDSNNDTTTDAADSLTENIFNSTPSHDIYNSTISSKDKQGVINALSEYNLKCSFESKNEEVVYLDNKNGKVDYSLAKEGLYKEGETVKVIETKYVPKPWNGAFEFESVGDLVFKCKDDYCFFNPSEIFGSRRRYYGEGVTYYLDDVKLTEAYPGTDDSIFRFTCNNKTSATLKVVVDKIFDLNENEKLVNSNYTIYTEKIDLKNAYDTYYPDRIKFKFDNPQ